MQLGIEGSEAAGVERGTCAQHTQVKEIDCQGHYYGTGMYAWHKTKQAPRKTASSAFFRFRLSGAKDTSKDIQPQNIQDTDYQYACLFN